MSYSTLEWLFGLLEPLLECRYLNETSINLSVELKLGLGLNWPLDQNIQLYC
jgi:hypothetical protein